MPSYILKCPKCEHKFEHVQSIMLPLLNVCPQCQSEGLNQCYEDYSFTFDTGPQTVGGAAIYNEKHKIGYYSNKEKEERAANPQRRRLARPRK